MKTLTPRTDNEVIRRKIDGANAEAVDSDFARTLEEEVKNLESALNEVRACFTNAPPGFIVNQIKELQKRAASMPNVKL